MKRNILTIIRAIRTKYPHAKILLAGLLLPINAGPARSKIFKDVYSDAAKEGKAILIPFKMQTEHPVNNFLLPDGMHPSAEGHHVYAFNIWNFIEPILNEMEK